MNKLMSFPLSTVNIAQKPFFMTFPAVITFLLILSHGFITATKAQNDNNGTDPFRAACAVWEIPTEAKKMRIAIPGEIQFPKFVTVRWSETLDEKRYDGFCIELFRKVLDIFRLEKNYNLPYEFVPHNNTYAQLVEGVSNGTFDAAVGDITILEERSKDVEFTQPYMESRLVMIAPAKSQRKAWKFLKPFTMEMWIATGAILIYTMFIVWILEHRTNEEFSGPWKDQLGTVIWFTFSSVFFAHREKINSNLTRLVVVVWLFVVLILTSSYTANLSSILTVSQLEPKVASIESLQKSNSTVGCDGDSFVMNFLEKEFGFKRDINIKTVGNKNEYIKEFESGNIAAAFLELPYGKAFINEHSKGYIMTEPKYKRFGGFGFVFKKCSPIATSVSDAILTLIENGKLEELEKLWFDNSFDSSDLETMDEAESLSLESFWGLYLISGATSTVLLFIHLLKNYVRRCSLWKYPLKTMSRVLFFIARRRARKVNLITFQRMNGSKKAKL